MSKASISRRAVLSSAALAGSIASLDSVTARTLSGGVPWEPGLADAPLPAAPGPYQFFTTEEVAFVNAAVARLIPDDELGPGAKEAGVTVFLDRQLAGPYGRAERWYMHGPWSEGSESQGYQSRRNPAQLYRAAIKSIDKHCRDTMGGKSFAELSPADQDRTLSGLEKGEIKLAGVESHSFFEQFRQNTIEGFFSDPIHGGNRDMVGWKLIGFPGARYDYRPYVSKHNQKLGLSPVGLKGRPEWTPRS